jgi:hypothetical protein
MFADPLVRDELMKDMFGSMATGPIYILRWIPLAAP